MQERYEQVVKRTMERSQNAKQKLSLLSRRAKANTNKGKNRTNGTLMGHEYTHEHSGAGFLC